MPLSEDEQRILSEIENQLYASDPQLARQVSSTTVYSDAVRGVRWGLVGVLVGLVVAVALLSVHPVLSFVIGFGLMLVSAWHLERSVRRLGRAGVDQVTQRMRAAGLRDYFGNASDRARERFRRRDDDA